jgi:hypothetical protein
MQENKSLVQEALIQMKNVEEAIAENAKGILASTMKEEINQLVKESLSEQDEDEVELDVDMEDDDSEEFDVDMDTDNEDEMDMDFDMDMDSEEESPIDLTDASDEEILKVFKAMGDEDGIIVKKDGNDIHLTDSNNDEEYLVRLGESEEDTMDKDMYLDEMDEMDVDTEDVINAIFSKDGDASDIEVEQDEEVMYEIEFDEEDDEEYLDEEEDLDEEEYLDEKEDLDDMTEEEEEDLDESYNPRKAVREAKSTIKPKGVGIGNGPGKTEIKKMAGGFNEKRKQGPKSVGTGKAKFEYKEGENMEGKSKVVKTETKEGGYGMNKGDKSKTFKGDKDYTTKKGDTLKTKAFAKEETKEAARTYGFGSKEGRGLRKAITPNRNFVYGKNGVRTESTQEEVNMLREKNEEYRKALNVFREKLNEVAIFNSNLAYATRLFTEHSTTKKEKINILRRFDNVETLKESKNLYQSIKGELSKTETKSMNESVGTKLNKQVSTGSSTTLIESKTYENPQFMRMKDLMGKLG